MWLDDPRGRSPARAVEVARVSCGSTHGLTTRRRLLDALGSALPDRHGRPRGLRLRSHHKAPRQLREPLSRAAQRVCVGWRGGGRDDHRPQRRAASAGAAAARPNRPGGTHPASRAVGPPQVDASHHPPRGPDAAGGGGPRRSARRRHGRVQGPGAAATFADSWRLRREPSDGRRLGRYAGGCVVRRRLRLLCRAVEAAAAQRGGAGDRARDDLRGRPALGAPLHRVPAPRGDAHARRRRAVARGLCAGRRADTAPRRAARPLARVPTALRRTRRRWWWRWRRQWWRWSNIGFGFGGGGGTDDSAAGAARAHAAACLGRSQAAPDDDARRWQHRRRRRRAQQPGCWSTEWHTTGCARVSGADEPCWRQQQRAHVASADRRACRHRGRRRRWWWCHRYRRGRRRAGRCAHDGAGWCAPRGASARGRRVGEAVRASRQRPRAGGGGYGGGYGCGCGCGWGRRRQGRRARPGPWRGRSWPRPWHHRGCRRRCERRWRRCGDDGRPDRLLRSSRCRQCIAATGDGCRSRRCRQIPGRRRRRRGGRRRWRSRPRAVDDWGGGAYRCVGVGGGKASRGEMGSERDRGGRRRRRDGDCGGILVRVRNRRRREQRQLCQRQRWHRRWSWRWRWPSERRRWRWRQGARRRWPWPWTGRRLARWRCGPTRGSAGGAGRAVVTIALASGRGLAVIAAWEASCAAAAAAAADPDAGGATAQLTSLRASDAALCRGRREHSRSRRRSELRFRLCLRGLLRCRCLCLLRLLRLRGRLGLRRCVARGLGVGGGGTPPAARAVQLDRVAPVQRTPRRQHRQHRHQHRQPRTRHLRHLWRHRGAALAVAAAAQAAPRRGDHARLPRRRPLLPGRRAAQGIGDGAALRQARLARRRRPWMVGGGACAAVAAARRVPSPRRHLHDGARPRQPRSSSKGHGVASAADAAAATAVASPGGGGCPRRGRERQRQRRDIGRVDGGDGEANRAACQGARRRTTGDARLATHAGRRRGRRLHRRGCVQRRCHLPP